MISNHDIKEIRKSQKYKVMKKALMVGLLLMVSMAALACNKSTQDSNNENDKIEDSFDQSTVSTTVMPTPAEESVITTEPTPTKKPESTAEPSLTKNPESTAKPTPAEQPAKVTEPASNSDFVSTKEAVHGTTALTHGNYLFYKTGKLTKTVIAAKNLNTSKVTELATIEDANINNGDFYLKGDNIYYHTEGDIYRVGVNGKNKTRLFKGTATILGFYNDDVIALDRKARELIRINKEGVKKTITKIKSIDTLEAVMVQDGLYYISKSSNNTLNENDPNDRLYYIDFDGKNKKEVYKDLDIYDMKTSENELFFLAISDEPKVMKLNKVKNREVTTIQSLSKEELEALGCNWFEANTFTLLAATASHVYYGIDFNNGEDMNIYSVGTDGDNNGLYLNAFDIKEINRSAYFMRGDIDEGYLKIVFDCDEDPVEIYLIDLSDKSTIKFEGGYYSSGSIDVEGEYVYYCKSSQLDRYGEHPEAYEYDRIEISTLK